MTDEKKQVTMNKSQIKQQILKHELYLKGEEHGELARFANIKIKDVDFGDQNLDGVIFSSVEFTDVSFEGTNLSYVEFNYCKFHNVKFTKTHLHYTRFTNNEISFSTFKDVELNHTYFADNIFESVDFVNPINDRIFGSKDKEYLTIKYSEFNNCNFNNANMKFVNFYYLSISNSSFADTNLSNSHIDDIKFMSSNLSGADITRADLKNVSFSDRSNLSDVDFSGSDLFNIDCGNSDLSRARFIDTTIGGSDYRINACFRSAIMTDVKGLDEMRCPKEGSLIGWKKVRDYDTSTTYIITLEIPEEADRSSALFNKCRCSKARVLDIEDLEGNKVSEVMNTTHTPTLYKVGENVYPDSFDTNRWDECSHGIHFFMTREEAVNYVF